MDILSQSQVSEIGGNGWMTVLFIAVVGVGVISVAAFFAFADLQDGGGALISLAVAIVFGAIAFNLPGWTSVEHTEYKVIINDFNEVHEEYEIVDQEGDIYTVIEKEDE